MCKNGEKMIYKKPIVIAEIGCNHKGNIEIAKELISTAATFCGADIVKFQKRCNKELLSLEQYNSPHPHPEHAYGKTYGEHREFLEFTIQQHEDLKNYCEQQNIIYSTSVWDLTSAKEITKLNPQVIQTIKCCNGYVIIIGGKFISLLV